MTLSHKVCPVQAAPIVGPVPEGECPLCGTFVAVGDSSLWDESTPSGRKVLLVMAHDRGDHSSCPKGKAHAKVAADATFPPTDESSSHPDHDHLRARHLDRWTCALCDADAEAIDALADATHAGQSGGWEAPDDDDPHAALVAALRERGVDASDDNTGGNVMVVRSDFGQVESHGRWLRVTVEASHSADGWLLGFSLDDPWDTVRGVNVLGAHRVSIATLSAAIAAIGQALIDGDPDLFPSWVAEAGLEEWMPSGTLVSVDEAVS